MGLTYFIYGASRGIGYEFVNQLSADPSNIVIGTVRSESQQLSKLASQKSNVHIVPLDVFGAPETLEKLPEAVKQYTDKIDVLISNAAISIDAIKPVTKVPAEAWIEHYKVNALAPTLLVGKLEPLLKAGSAKRIVFISTMVSSLGQFSPVSSSVYGQSKAALNFVAKLLDYEWKDEGFSVVAVHPGVVKTDMFTDFKKGLGEDSPFKGQIDTLAISPEQSVSELLKVIDSLGPSNSGKFLNYDGSELVF